MTRVRTVIARLDRSSALGAGARVYDVSRKFWKIYVHAHNAYLLQSFVFRSVLPRVHSSHCPPYAYTRLFFPPRAVAKRERAWFVKFAHLFVYRHTIELKTRLSLYECVDTDGVCAATQELHPLFITLRRAWWSSEPRCNTHLPLSVDRSFLSHVLSLVPVHHAERTACSPWNASFVEQHCAILNNLPAHFQRRCRDNSCPNAGPSARRTSELFACVSVRYVEGADIGPRWRDIFERIWLFQVFTILSSLHCSEWFQAKYLSVE